MKCRARPFASHPQGLAPTCRIRTALASSRHSRVRCRCSGSAHMTLFSMRVALWASSPRECGCRVGKPPWRSVDWMPRAGVANLCKQWSVGQHGLSRREIALCRPRSGEQLNEDRNAQAEPGQLPFGPPPDPLRFDHAGDHRHRRALDLHRACRCLAVGAHPGIALPLWVLAGAITLMAGLACAQFAVCFPRPAASMCSCARRTAGSPPSCTAGSSSLPATAVPSRRWASRWRYS